MGEINYKKLIAAANAIDMGQVRSDTKGEYAGHIKCLGDFFYDTPNMRETEPENYSSYELDMFSKYDEYGAKTFHVEGSLIVSCYDNSYFDYDEEESNEEERIGYICELAYKDAEALIVQLTENVYDNLEVVGKVLCAYHLLCPYPGPCPEGPNPGPPIGRPPCFPPNRFRRYMKCTIQ